MSGLERCADGYCVVPAGSFWMGSKDGDPDEQPVRDVVMSEFRMGQTEVSIGRYTTFLKEQSSATKLVALISGCGESNKSKALIAKKGETREQLMRKAVLASGEEKCAKKPSIHQIPEGLPVSEEYTQNLMGDNYPVVGLAPDEMRAFCRAEGGDLPTAAQLHFAARFDEEDIPKDQLVIRDNGFMSTEPVDANQTRKNRFGIFNLLGNVWEVSRDAYNALFYSGMASLNPHKPLTDQSGQFYEVSGGSYYSVPEDIRAANRDAEIPGYRGFDNGFRCVR